MFTYTWSDLNVHYTEDRGICILESCKGACMEIQSRLQNLSSFMMVFIRDMSIERGFTVCSSEMASNFHSCLLKLKLAVLSMSAE